VISPARRSTGADPCDAGACRSECYKAEDGSGVHARLDQQMSCQRGGPLWRSHAVCFATLDIQRMTASPGRGTVWPIALMYTGRDLALTPFGGT
jgi:hypothetical protein